jgi:hypothetical protein
MLQIGVISSLFCCRDKSGVNYHKHHHEEDKNNNVNTVEPSFIAGDHIHAHGDDVWNDQNRLSEPEVFAVWIFYTSKVVFLQV